MTQLTNFTHSIIPILLIRDIFDSFTYNTIGEFISLRRVGRLGGDHFCV